MKIRTAVVALLSVWSAGADDSAPARAISLTVGKGELLQFEQDVARVAIAEPRIADAIIVSPRDVMVNAKGAGQTTLVIWEKDLPPARYDVNVVSDTVEH